MVVREPAKCFTDLICWQKAHRLVLSIYEFSGGFPKSETYGLISQLRRAAVSVPANIAEGFRRKGDADMMRLLNYAQSSLEECRYYLILARDLGYGDDVKIAGQLEEVSKVLTGYVNAIRKKKQI